MFKRGDSRRLRVCFVAGTLGQGGAERQLFYMVRALCDSGVDARVLCLTREEFWETRLLEIGVSVTWVGARRSRWWRLRQIVRELKKNPADILQSQHFYTNIYAALAARVLGMMEIGAIRNNVVNEVVANGPALGRMSLRLPRLLAANSSAAIATAQSYGVNPERLILLPNVVDTERFQPRPRVPCDEVHILAVGRLVAQKNYHRLLRVIQRLRARTANRFRLSIVGAGPLQHELKLHAASLGLMPGIVHFHGAAQDMSKVYDEADLLVSTSDYEGMPNVVMEAMASGLPVAATGVGGVRELVRDGQHGFVVPPDDEEALVRALGTLVERHDLRQTLGRQSREHVLNHFSVKQLPGSLDNLYQRAFHIQHG